MKTVVIQIGNSDNKLSQSEWSHFAHAVRHSVERFGIETHFSGGSDWDAPWQNACWICEVPDTSVELFVCDLNSIRHAYKQESIAIIIGDVVFI